MSNIESKYIVDAFLSKRFPNKIQIFNTKNTAGDRMETIYNDGTVKIDFCSHWGYIEIFGLSGEDYEYIFSCMTATLSQRTDFLLYRIFLK